MKIKKKIEFRTDDQGLVVFGDVFSICSSVCGIARKGTAPVADTVFFRCVEFFLIAYLVVEAVDREAGRQNEN
jgi:hypothetical protein